MNDTNSQSSMAPGEFTRRVLELRADRDYLQMRLRLQHDLHDAQADLVRLHKEHIDRLRPLVEEREQLLAAIPSAQGSVSQALKFLRGLVSDERGVRSGAGARPLGGASAQPLQRESLCVAEVSQEVRGPSILRCLNCGVVVHRIEYREPTAEPEVAIEVQFKPFWAAHVASKSPSDNLPAPAPEVAMEYPGVCTCSCDLCRRGAHCAGMCCSNHRPGSLSELFEQPAVSGAAGMDPVCSCGCDLCRRGAHCGGYNCRFGPAQSARDPNAANPNAGVKQAFPNGRWGGASTQPLGETR